MPNFEVNTQVIELIPQENAPFLHLAGNIIPALAAGEPFAKICSHVITEGMKAKVATDHPLFQCAMWMMYQIGVRGLSVDFEKEEINIKQTEKSELDGVPYEQHFSSGNAGTGRAMVATLMMISNRALRINGEEVQVRPQPLETMKRVNAEVLQSRKFGEELHVTALRRLMMLLVGGTPREDPEVLAAMQVVADLNVRSFSFTPDGTQVSLEGFSETNAMAMAYLHNMDPVQMESMLQRVRNLNLRCQESNPSEATKANSPRPTPRRRQ